MTVMKKSPKRVLSFVLAFMMIASMFSGIGDMFSTTASATVTGRGDDKQYYTEVTPETYNTLSNIYATMNSAKPTPLPSIATAGDLSDMSSAATYFISQTDASGKPVLDLTKAKIEVADKYKGLFALSTDASTNSSSNIIKTGTSILTNKFYDHWDTPDERPNPLQRAAIVYLGPAPAADPDLFKDSYYPSQLESGADITSTNWHPEWDPNYSWKWYEGPDGSFASMYRNFYSKIHPGESTEGVEYKGLLLDGVCFTVTFPNAVAVRGTTAQRDLVVEVRDILIQSNGIGYNGINLSQKGNFGGVSFDCTASSATTIGRDGGGTVMMCNFTDRQGQSSVFVNAFRARKSAYPTTYVETATNKAIVDLTDKYDTSAHSISWIEVGIQNTLTYRVSGASGSEKLIWGLYDLDVWASWPHSHVKSPAAGHIASRDYQLSMASQGWNNFSEGIAFMTKPDELYFTERGGDKMILGNDRLAIEDSGTKREIKGNSVWLQSSMGSSGGYNENSVSADTSGLNWGSGFRALSSASATTIRWAGCNAGTLIGTDANTVHIWSQCQGSNAMQGKITFSGKQQGERKSVNASGIGDTAPGHAEEFYIADDPVTYKVEATGEDYVIAKLTIDGQEVSAAVGQKTYTKEFGPIACDHTIYAEFKEDGGDDEIVDGDLYNVYFDYNYEGGGVTTGLYGTYEYKRVKEVSGTIGEDGGTVTSQEETVTLGIPWSYPEAPKRDGYTFAGWAKTRTATNGSMTPADPKGPAVYYATWTPKNYSVSWNTNGGSGGSGGTTSGHYDDAIVPRSAPSKTGYSFNGWYTDSSCSTPLATGTLIGELAGSGTSVSLYAGWTADPVYVTYYDTRSGTSMVGTQTYQYGDTLKLLAPIEDTEGWHFVGWDKGAVSLTSGNVTAVTTTGTSGTPSASRHWVMDVKAKWAQDYCSYTTTINWDDSSDNDGCRPTSVVVGLVSSETGAVVAEKTVDTTSGNSQTVTFANLPVMSNSSSTEKIVYSSALLSYTDLTENSTKISNTEATSGLFAVQAIADAAVEPLLLYSYAINNYNGQYTTTIDLSHDRITTGTDIKYTIKWDDDSDRDGMRPGAVKLLLYADGVAVTDSGVASVSDGSCEVSEDGNTWTYIFRDYQKYKNGSLVKYTVAVTNDDGTTKFNENGYTTTYFTGTTNDPVGATIARSPDTVTPTVTINWNDQSNRDGTRPDFISVELHAQEYNDLFGHYDDRIVGYTELKGQDVTSDTWTDTFGALPKYSNGREIIYYADVNSDVNIKLMRDDPTYSIATVRQSNTDTAVTISHGTIRKTVNGTIEWNDNDNIDGLRPDSVRVQLYADNVPVDGNDYNVIVSGDSTAKNWNVQFDNVPVYREGKEGEEIVYSFRVTEYSAGELYGAKKYEVSYVDNNGAATSDAAKSNEMYVKLSHDTLTAPHTAVITWKDGSNRDNTRPDEVTIQLDAYRMGDDGKYETVKVADYTIGSGEFAVTDDVWTHEFTDLEDNHNGKPVRYEVKVVSNLNGEIDSKLEQYDWTATGMNIVITKDIDRKNISGTIEWNDENNIDGVRPEFVRVQLYADNAPVDGNDYNVVISGDSKEKNWDVQFSNVPVNREGKEGEEIIYSFRVTEFEAGTLYGANGYNATYVDANGAATDDSSKSHEMYVKTDRGPSAAGRRSSGL